MSVDVSEASRQLLVTQSQLGIAKQQIEVLTRENETSTGVTSMASSPSTQMTPTGFGASLGLASTRLVLSFTPVSTVTMPTPGLTSTTSTLPTSLPQSSTSLARVLPVPLMTTYPASTASLLLQISHFSSDQKDGESFEDWLEQF